MERGKVLEPEAFEYFAFHTDMEPTKCGLVYRGESRMVACSPDGLVTDEAGLELKCPSAHKHLMYLARGVCPSEYWPQVQGSMYVTGRKLWWFMSHFPNLPPFITARRAETTSTTTPSTSTSPPSSQNCSPAANACGPWA